MVPDASYQTVGGYGLEREKPGSDEGGGCGLTWSIREKARKKDLICVYIDNQTRSEKKEE